MRLRDLLGKGKVSDDPTDPRKLISIQGEASQPDQAQLDRIQNFPFKYEVIHDETNELILEDKVSQVYHKPKLDDTGKIVFLKEKTKDGEQIVRDGNNNPIPEYEAHVIINDHYASILNALSHRTMLSFLQKSGVELYNLWVEQIVDLVELDISEEDFDLGTGNYLTSLKLQGFVLSNDAINGNKVKALLEHRKTTKFEFEEQKNKRGFF